MVIAFSNQYKILFTERLQQGTLEESYKASAGFVYSIQSQQVWKW